MVTKNDKYKNDSLFLEAKRIRELHIKLKNLIHVQGVKIITKDVPSRQEMIVSGALYTEFGKFVVKLCKRIDKKSSTKSKKTINLVEISDNLAKLLELEERGITRGPNGNYICTAPLVTSMFGNFTFATGRQSGDEIKLFGKNDPLVTLFENELKSPGSGPTNKKTGEKTCVLNSKGEQINPFKMNRHMTIFSSHYIKSDNDKKKRKVVNKDDVPELYEKIVAEHKLFTDTLHTARDNYKAALKKYDTLKKKKDDAVKVGDDSIKDALLHASDEYKKTKKIYLDLMNKNNIKHNIV